MTMIDKIVNILIVLIEWTMQDLTHLIAGIILFTLTALTIGRIIKSITDY